VRSVAIGRECSRPTHHVRRGNAHAIPILIALDRYRCCRANCSAQPATIQDGYRTVSNVGCSPAPASVRNEVNDDIRTYRSRLADLAHACFKSFCRAQRKALYRRRRVALRRSSRSEVALRTSNSSDGLRSCRNRFRDRVADSHSYCCSVRNGVVDVPSTVCQRGWPALPRRRTRRCTRPRGHQLFLMGHRPLSPRGG
jgi:hypothetical protein